jgi:integrase
VRDDRFYALYLLAATTGLRRAELCGLRWPAIDLDHATLAVEGTRVVVNGRPEDSDGKTNNAPRLLALDPTTIAALIEFQDRQRAERAFFDRDYAETDRIFTWEDGRAIHPDVIRQRFNRLAAGCGLPRIRLHDIRHSYATAALKAHINPKIVSQRLGHSSVAFTLSVYSHVLPGFDQDAATLMAGLSLADDAQATPKISDDARPTTMTTRPTTTFVSNRVSKGDENARPDDLWTGVCAGSGDRI